MKASIRPRHVPGRASRLAGEIALAVAITMAAVAVFLFSRGDPEELVAARPENAPPAETR